jgi:hypothetical protein
MRSIFAFCILVGAVQGVSSSNATSLNEEGLTDAVSAVISAEGAEDSYGGACEPTPDPRKLRFSVCNGMASQRLSIVYAAVLAAVTNRTLELPNYLVANGARIDEASAAAGHGYRTRTSFETPDAPDQGWKSWESGSEIRTNALRFEAVYNPVPLVAALAAHGVRSLLGGPAIPSKPSAATAPVIVSLAKEHNALAALKRESVACASHVTLSQGCPAFRVPPSVMTRFEQLVLDVLAALVPAAPLAAHVAAVVTALGGKGSYDALHLRFESDWHAQCAFERSVAPADADGTEPLWPSTVSFGGPHCGILPARELVDALVAVGLGSTASSRPGGASAGGAQGSQKPAVPIFVAAYASALQPSSLLAALRTLLPTLVLKGDLLPAAALGPLSREALAVIDYHVVLQVRVSL